ncbi:MAG TPA: PAS domain-containing protein [Candidatus Polarisedimenticolia bacterium]|jgi:PAS domain S-box-containing protein|nr:PAS domain-containing protein [Candidatus Polarisedimenticolia bacterium]
MPQQANRKHQDGLRRHNEQLTRLCRLTADVARLGDERTTLKKIVNTAASLIGVAGAHIALVDRNEKELYGVISSGRHPHDAPRLKFQLSQAGGAQQALKSCRPVAIRNADDDARVNPRARDIMAIRGVAYLPLMSGRESFGLLILITRRPHSWTSRELDLARHFANLSSVALENSRLMAQLAETEARLRSLIEHIPAIIYLCDVDPPYRTRYISPQAASMLGYSEEEWTRDRDFFMKILHPDDAGQLIQLGEEAIRKKGIATSEYRLLDRQGEVRWFRDETVLVRDPSGNPVGWHGVLVEITGLKKTYH